MKKHHPFSVFKVGIICFIVCSTFYGVASGRQFEQSNQSIQPNPSIQLGLSIQPSPSIQPNPSIQPDQFSKVNHSRIDIQKAFTVSGWMGDGEYGRQYIDFSANHSASSHSPASSLKFSYTFGPTRWGGVYWQNKPDNFGKMPGTDFSDKGITKLTFWGKGELGNEVVEFKVGGINNVNANNEMSNPIRYKDSFSATTGRLTLSKVWKKYEISLVDSDLSSVIGGFCWVASADYNSAKSVTFHLQDIYFE